MNINKNLFIIIIGRIFQILIMLISIRLLTSMLTVSEIGNYYILSAILSFYSLVLFNPIETYMNRHINIWKTGKNLFNSLFVFFIMTFIIAIISIPISLLIYNLSDYSNNFNIYIFVLFIFISLVINSLHRKIVYGLNILHYRNEFVIYLLTTLVFGLIFSVIIVSYYDLAIAWLSGMILSESLILYFIFKIFVQNNKLNITFIKNKLTKNKLQSIAYFIMPIALTTFLMWGQNTAYRLIIEYQYSAEVLGLIGIGFTVSSAVFNAVQSVAMQYFNPIFLSKINNANKLERTEAWNSMAKQIVPIYILTLVFTIALSQVLVNLLLDEKFHNVYIYTMIGAGIEFFRAMTNLLINVSQSEYKTKSTIKPYLFGFLIVMLSFLIIDFTNQYYMIAMVLLFAYFISYLFMYISMKKLLDIKYNLHLLRLFIFLIPFSSILYFTKNSDIMYNLLLLTIYGIYYLVVMLYIFKINNQEIKDNR